MMGVIIHSRCCTCDSFGDTWHYLNVFCLLKKVKAVYSCSWETHLRAMGVAIWDHTVLPVTQHKWTCPALTPASQDGTRFTYPRGMEGWVDLGGLIAARPGIEPTTVWSQVWRLSNRHATESPRLDWLIDWLIDWSASCNFDVLCRRWTGLSF